MLFATNKVFQIKENYSVMLDPISGIVPAALLFFIGLGLTKCRIKKEKNPYTFTGNNHQEWLFERIAKWVGWGGVRFGE